MTSQRFVTVRSAVAPMLAEPRIATALSSQQLAGDVLTVLDESQPWMHVRSVDQYEGWMHVGYVSASSGSEGMWRWSLGCRVRRPDGIVRSLPLGARIEPAAELIDGETIEAVDRVTRFPNDAHSIASSSERLFAGAPYQWGGVSPWGCDCSGFVQRVFMLHGVMLPRDAWQQALVGASRSLLPDAMASDSPTIGDNLAPADLLFFSDRDDRRVTHVGVALGGDRMAHSSLMRGGVAIERLHSGDDYTARLRAQCVDIRTVL